MAKLDQALTNRILSQNQDDPVEQNWEIAHSGENVPMTPWEQYAQILQTKDVKARPYSLNGLRNASSSLYDNPAYGLSAFRE